jgi:hypothetical protein
VYHQGQHYAFRVLGIAKYAAPKENVLKHILRRLARGRSKVPLDSIQDPTISELLIGRPQEVLKPRRLWSQVASLEPTRNAMLALQGLGPEGAGVWPRLKGTGQLGVDLLHKGLVFGLPGYLGYKALQRPAPGKTRGEEIGRAVGQSLGWLPPMGILGTAATVASPGYSMPGIIGSLGENAGGAVSQLVGEQPTPLEPPSLRVRTST